MGFIRIKKIKGNSYGYGIENTWKKRKKESRQSVSKYLGKIAQFDVVSDKVFDSSLFLKKKKAQIVEGLIEHELSKRGFVKEEDLMKGHDLTFSLPLRKFIDEKGEEQKLVVQMNEGFLCKMTLRRLINFRSNKDDEREKGIDLAKAFLEAGLKVPEELFIEYFRKI